MKLHTRRRKFAAVSALLSISATLLVMDTALRFFPVSDGLRGVPVNENNPVYRFAPNRTLRWSKGWNFFLVNEIRTNNYGFINDIDYDPAAMSPLLAVIGDSFVEAAMVPYRQTAAGNLQASVKDIGRVYSFGASGAALSQYLAYARYVRDEFHPDGMVIIVVGNDFDESLLKYRSNPGFHYFVETENDRLVLKRIDRSIPWWKDMLMMPTLGRYLVMNLEFGNPDQLRERIVSFFGNSPQFVGNVPANADPVRLSDSKKAVDAFLDMLPAEAGLRPDHIVLVLDAPRPEIYSLDRLAAVQDSYFEIMRRYLTTAASEKGFGMIDMEQVFISDYQRTGLKYEFPNDYHWNPVGHEVVARSIQHTKAFADIFDRNKAGRRQ
ncbi:SGNH/GDSL hydrolase family protein [Nitrospira sp. Nam80]